MDRNEPGASRTVSQELEDLLAARSGEQRAAERLVEQHAASMKRTAWRVLGRYSVEEAEDVVQEALIAALTTDALPRGDVGAWLRAIAARKAIDAVRASGRRHERPLAADGPSAASLEDPRSHLNVLAVRQALSRLSAMDRATLTLVDLEGFSMAEAAELLGTTRVAIRLRAVRARRKLARLLARVDMTARREDEARVTGAEAASGGLATRADETRRERMQGHARPTEDGP
jgi:RNA polymerase sigma-70 factor (ECF subfamily)